LTSEPLTRRYLAWETVMIFLLKSFLHWAFGQCIAAMSLEVSNENEVDERNLAFEGQTTPHIGLYSIGNLFGYFATFLAFRKPRGPQPAAHGHIQTLADLVDDWTTDPNGVFWWGDKEGVSEIARHAGMSLNWPDLAKIRIDELYAG
jgi:hypothetical protein